MRANNLNIIPMDKNAKINAATLITANKTKIGSTSQAVGIRGPMNITNIPQESFVGKVLIERYTKTLIMIVLLLLLVVPFLRASLIHPQQSPCTYTVRTLLLY